MGYNFADDNTYRLPQAEQRLEASECGRTMGYMKGFQQVTNDIGLSYS